MSRELPPLSYLRAFEATARLGSVSRAAKELGRTHGAVSKQLQLLQEHVGVRLFDKVGTGIRPNRLGQAFQTVVTDALKRLESGYRDLRSSSSEPSVHVACSATFAMRWLVPHLSEFYRRHPNWRVDLTMTSRSGRQQESSARDGVDIVLSWDRLSTPTLDKRALPLADVVFGLVSAPSYPVKMRGSQRSFSTRISHEHTSDAWSRWQAATEYDVVWEAELTFPHTHLCIGAAVAGLGVALVEHRLVSAELSTAQLVAHPGVVRIANGFLAKPNPRREISPAASAFLSWLREALTTGV
ncbi:MULTISPECIES: LysR substrate-binding domain-containing protein [unclassified Bradyrhizobium]|uniref:LysR substrate-binding domain-containing protein n=1 Tax=unclassified Bradyrhizobium TaxID=2631580 RepID=UPI002916AF5A|nr:MULTISPECIES: LysR substrate-binding domain-containing protein [unclassified Bradyrhizobium]